MLESELIALFPITPDHLQKMSLGLEQPNVSFAVPSLHKSDYDGWPEAKSPPEQRRGLVALFVEVAALGLASS